MLATGNDPSIFTDALYVGASFALLLPLLAVAAVVGDTFRRGAFRLTSPVLFAIGSLLLLLLAAALNAARVVDPLDLVGTSADSASGGVTTLSCQGNTSNVRSFRPAPSIPPDEPHPGRGAVAGPCRR